MLSAKNCIAKAQELADMAAASPADAAERLLMAVQWLDVAKMAEWQDAYALNEIAKLNDRMR